MTQRLFYLATLLACPALLLAEEAAPAADAGLPSLPADAPWWAQAIWIGFTVILLPFILNFLRKKNQAASAEAEKLQLDANKSLMEQKNIFIDKRVIPFLWSTAEHIASRDLPIVLKDAIDGDGKFDWKAHADRMKDELFEDVKEKFFAEGIDVVKILGEKYLGKLIDRAIAKAIPFLPQTARPFAKNIAKGRGADLAGLIIDKGLAIANKKFLNGGLDLSEE